MYIFRCCTISLILILPESLSVLVRGQILTNSTRIHRTFYFLGFRTKILGASKQFYKKPFTM